MLEEQKKAIHKQMNFSWLKQAYEPSHPIKQTERQDGWVD